MNIDIARAWKNALYRETLTSEELTQLPENPIGTLELTDEDLISVDGACGGSCGGNFNSYGNSFGGGFDPNSYGFGEYGFGQGGYTFGHGGSCDGGYGLGIGLGGRIIFGGGC